MPPRDPDLETRGRLMRGLGTLREMLPGSFVERKRACGRPNCRCADGQNLHVQYQISVLVDGGLLVEGEPSAIAADPRVRAVYLGQGEQGGRDG